jgi:hypothetical protein
VKEFEERERETVCSDYTHNEIWVGSVKRRCRVAVCRHNGEFVDSTQLEYRLIPSLEVYIVFVSLVRFSFVVCSANIGKEEEIIGCISVIYGGWKSNLFCSWFTGIL